MSSAGLDGVCSVTGSGSVPIAVPASCPGPLRRPVFADARAGAEFAMSRLRKRRRPAEESEISNKETGPRQSENPHRKREEKENQTKQKTAELDVNHRLLF